MNKKKKAFLVAHALETGKPYRFCSDCRHCYSPWWERFMFPTTWTRFAKCHRNRKVAFRVNIVSGSIRHKNITGVKDCDTSREASDPAVYCCAEGQWWEPKQGWRAKLKEWWNGNV